MDLRLLYFDGCPNWKVTEERLQKALRIARIQAEVTLVDVPSAEEAERLAFRGSPTVLVDGGDPFADESAPVGLSCRVFPTPEGLRGSPTVEQLVAALKSGPGSPPARQH